MRALRPDWSLESIKTKIKQLRLGAPDQSRPLKRRRTRTTPSLRGWRRRCDPQETGKLHSRSSQCGTRGFPGSPPTRNTLLLMQRRCILSNSNQPRSCGWLPPQSGGLCTLRLGVGFQSSKVSTMGAPAVTMSSQRREFGGVDRIDRQFLYHHTECIDDAQLHHRSSSFHHLPDDDDGSRNALCEKRLVIQPRDHLLVQTLHLGHRIAPMSAETT